MKKQSQNKPNLLNAQMNVTTFKTMNYEQRTMNDANKNKPNQTQLPQRDTQYAIRDTKYKPNQTQPVKTKPRPPSHNTRREKASNGVDAGRLYSYNPSVFLNLKVSIKHPRR